MSILFGILVGIALGLTGGGGSIFAVPLLIYGIGVPAKSAVAISLAAVAATAAMGAAEGLWRRVVELRAALIFAVAGMITAPLGVQLGELVSDTVVVISFAVLMLAVAVRMVVTAMKSPSHSEVVRARFAEQAQAEPGTVCRYAADGRLRLNAPCSAALFGAGITVGVLSGFFGVGGGFLVVPALMLITQMGIHRAVATSLLVITLIGVSGVISAAFSGREIDWILAGLFVLGGVGGMFAGRGLARLLAGTKLQLVFATCMLGTATFLLLEKLPLSTLL